MEKVISTEKTKEKYTRKLMGFSMLGREKF